MILFVGVLSSLYAVTFADVNQLTRQNQEKMSAFQRRVFQNKSLLAQSASTAATPELLKLLGDPQMFWALQKLGGEAAALAVQGPHVLLKRLREEVAVTEILTGFPASNLEVASALMCGMNLSIVSSADHLYNSWELEVLNLSSQNCSDVEQEAEDKMQQVFFGCRPFKAGKSKPGSLREAQDRITYAAQNIMRLDEGECAYGSIRLVLSRKYINDMGIVSPVDTGWWHSSCALHKLHDLACSSWPTPRYMGTLDYMDHVLLHHPHLMAPMVPGKTAIAAMARMIGRFFDPNHISLRTWVGMDMFGYLEVGVLGKVFLPDSIRFILASFATLFGTSQGDNVVSWALQHGRPVAWVFGTVPLDSLCNWDFNSSGHTASFAEPRILDPRTATVTNATFTQDNQTFAELIQLASKLRAQQISASIDPKVWTNLWHKAVHRLGPEYQLLPLRAHDCSDTESCIGTCSGTCVCSVLATRGKYTDSSAFVI